MIILKDGTVVTHASQVTISTGLTLSEDAAGLPVLSAVGTDGGDHNHDTRYYTKTELNTSGGAGQVHWDRILNPPATYAPSAHTHDDRYFTETESDARFAPVSHGHSWEQITSGVPNFARRDLANTFDASNTFSSLATFSNVSASAQFAVNPLFGTTTIANPEVGRWNPLYSAIAAGRPLYFDEEFASGLNSVGVYNNSTGGAVSITRIADAGAPNRTGYVLQIANNGGTTSPGLGGFVQNITSRRNATFVQRFRAKIPVGYSVMNAENSQGTNATVYWLTSKAGTGEWEEYIRVVSCGNTGTFAGGGHVYLNGPAGAVTWYLASCNVYEVQESGGLGISDSRITDLSASKLTGTLHVDRLPVVPLTKGGTGTSSYSGVNHLVRINAAGTAFETVVPGSAGTYLRSDGSRFIEDTIKLADVPDLSSLYASANHNHDTRYYTQSQSDLRYATLLHVHDADEITTGVLLRERGGTGWNAAAVLPRHVYIGPQSVVAPATTGSADFRALEWLDISDRPVVPAVTPNGLVFANGTSFTNLAGEAAGTVVVSTGTGSAFEVRSLTLTDFPHNHNTLYYTKSETDTKLGQVTVSLNEVTGPFTAGALIYALAGDTELGQLLPHSTTTRRMLSSVSSGAPAWVELAWSDIRSGVPNTLSGYGITDALTATSTRGLHKRPRNEVLGNLVDGTFEHGSDLWDTFSATFDDTYVYAGQQSIKATSYSWAYSDYIPVHEGQELYCEVWTYRETGATGTAGTLYLGWERYHDDFTTITDSVGATVGNNATVYPVSGVTPPSNSTWTKHSGSYTVAGAGGTRVAYVRLRVLMNYNAGTIPTWYSNIRAFRSDILGSGAGITALNADNVASGTLAAVRGGTGQNAAFVANRLFYAASTTAMGQVPQSPVATGVLQQGTTGAPAFSQLSYTALGNLPTLPSTATPGLVFSNGAGAFSNLAGEAAGTVVVSTGTGSAFTVRSLTLTDFPHDHNSAYYTKGQVDSLLGGVTVSLNEVTGPFTSGSVIYAETDSLLGQLLPHSTTTRRFMSSVSSGAPAWNELAWADITSGVPDFARRDLANTFALDQRFTTKLLLTTLGGADVIARGTDWGQGFWLGANLDYGAASADPLTQAIYVAGPGASGTGGVLLRMDGNSKRIQFFTAPTSTAAGAAATLTERLRIQDGFVDVMNSPFRVGGVDVLTTGRELQNITFASALNVARTNVDNAFTVDQTLAAGKMLLSAGGVAAAPTFTTRSAGTRFVVFPNVTATNLDYALGIESSHLWFSSASGFKWYANSTTAAMTLSSGGTLTVATVAAALSGNATTATTLQTARTINGVSFNGSANITVPAAASTLTGLAANRVMIGRTDAAGATQVPQAAAADSYLMQGTTGAPTFGRIQWGHVDAKPALPSSATPGLVFSNGAGTFSNLAGEAAGTVVVSTGTGSAFSVRALTLTDFPHNHNTDYYTKPEIDTKLGAVTVSLNEVTGPFTAGSLIYALPGDTELGQLLPNAVASRRFLSSVSSGAPAWYDFTAADITTGTLGGAIGLGNFAHRGRQVSAAGRWFFNVAAYAHSTSGAVGAVVIKTNLLAEDAATNTMAYMKIVGYDYSVRGPFEMLIGGYFYANGTGAAYIANPGYRNTGVWKPTVTAQVSPDGYWCIVLGGVTDTTSYMKLAVTELMLGHQATEAMADGWTISLVTDLVTPGYSSRHTFVENTSIPFGNISGTATAAQIPTLDIGTKTSGTLTVARGGTGATSVTARHVFMGPTAAGAPAFRAFTWADIVDAPSIPPLAGAGITYSNGTAWSKIQAGPARQVVMSDGGTGFIQDSVRVGDIIQSVTPTTFAPSFLGTGTTGNTNYFLRSDGVWATTPPTTSVAMSGITGTGTAGGLPYLPVASGDNGPLSTLLPNSTTTRKYLSQVGTGTAPNDMEWVTLPADTITSVFGRTGAVVAQANDYTWAQIGSKPTTLQDFGITGGTLSSTLTVTNGVYINGASTSNRDLVFSTANVARMIWSLPNGDATLNLYRYNDAGAYLGTAISVARATGAVTLEGALAVGGAITSGGTAVSLAGHTHTYAQLSNVAYTTGRVTTDLNDASMRVSGMYGLSSTNLNLPGGGAYNAMIVAANSDVGLQIVGGYQSNTLYVRGWATSGTTWYQWYTLLSNANYATVISDNSLPWVKLSGKPTTLDGYGITGGTFTGAVGFASYAALATGQPLYFDNGTGGHTYIRENGNDVMQFVRGGSEALRLDGTGATFSGAVVSGGNVTGVHFYFTNGNYIQASAADARFLTSVNAALPIMIGGLVVSDSYADTGPAGGIFSKGNITTNGSVNTTSASGYQIAGVSRLFETGNYTYFQNGDATAYIAIGKNDTATYHNNSTHHFRDLASVVQATLTSSSLLLKSGSWFASQGNAGFWNQTYNSYLYSDTVQGFRLQSNDAAIAFLRLDQNTGTRLGMLYGDGAGFGLLNAGGSWAVRINANTGNPNTGGTLYGNWFVDGTLDATVVKQNGQSLAAVKFQTTSPTEGATASEPDGTFIVVYS